MDLVLWEDLEGAGGEGVGGGIGMGKTCEPKAFSFQCMTKFTTNKKKKTTWKKKEATVRTGHGTTNWFQIEKGVHEGCILSPCLFNLYAEYIMQNAGLDEAEARIKIARRLISISIPTSDMQKTPPLWQKAKNYKAS